jgi:hypothetical protein
MRGSGNWMNRCGWRVLLGAVLAAALLAGLGLTLMPSLALEEAGTSVLLDPPSQSISSGVGKTATVFIKVASVMDLYGAEVRLKFDQNLLAVQDADAARSGIQLSPSNALFAFQPENLFLDAANNRDYYYQYSDINGGYFIAECEADNSSGQASYVFSLLSPLPPADAGAEGQVLATITFNCLAAGKADINLEVVKLADSAGGPITIASNAGASVEVLPEFNVDIVSVLQGSSRPDAGWIVPLTVNFFSPGADVMTADPLYSFEVTTSKSGNTATAQLAVNPGLYDISLVTPHSLVNVKRGVSVASTSTIVALGTLLEGNANDDNKVNIQDFGLLAKTYGRSNNDAGFDARADFDRNNKINITDFGLLAANYGKYSPVQIP